MSSPPLSLPEPHVDEPLDPSLRHGLVSPDSGDGAVTLETDHEYFWLELAHFYAENERTIEDATSVDVTSIIDPVELRTTIDSFTENVQVILDGLVALSNVHPVLGAAIFAFHSVISLDLTRRENNRKVLAVKLQMQNMMCSMFQLRKLKHVHVEGSERKEQREWLQHLVEAIADDIKECGSDLNYYMDRTLISKLIKAKTYKRRFGDYIETFNRRRAELESMIISYTAAGVDANNIAIAEVGRKVDKLGSIVQSMFEKLDTPNERAGLNFIAAHEGAKNCVETTELLLQLLSKVGETPPVTEKQSSVPERLASLRNSFVMELNEDLNEALAKHHARFNQLLTVQSNNLAQMSRQIEDSGYRMHIKLDKITKLLIQQDGKVITKVVVPNATVKLKDPELEKIWNQMGLKKSVKAKHFVLTFRDYLLADRSVPGTPNPLVPQSLQPDSSSMLFTGPHPVSKSQQEDRLNVETTDDAWVLKYIDVAYVHPVIEAMDTDGSGFISVMEANKFALSRPKGWSVFRWIAYWAAGWHINLASYKARIYSILHQMLHAIEIIHPANRIFADYYFHTFLMTRVEGLVRSIKPVPDNVSKDSRLSEIAESMAALQESQLMENLQAVSFVIKSTSEVTLIAGSNRIETWILPLMYLLLKRHLDILNVAKTVVLHPQELEIQSTSLLSIFSVFNDRQSQLEAIFRQMYRNVEAQFENHSYGMFLASFKEDYSPARSGLSTDEHTGVFEPESDSKIEQKKPLDLSILSQDAGPVFDFQNFEVARQPQNFIPHPLEGAWVGMCTLFESPESAYQGPFGFTIGSIMENRISGQGDNYLDIIDYQGQIKSDEDGCLTLLLRISWQGPISRNYRNDHLLLRGQYNPETETIQGSWVAVPKDGDDGKWAGFPFMDAEGNETVEDFLDRVDAIGGDDSTDSEENEFEDDDETEDGIDGVQVEGSLPTDSKGDEETKRESDTDEAEGSVAEAQSELTFGTFYMTKRSPDILRFRHLLWDAGPDSSWSLARKRWRFAISVICFQVQHQTERSTFWHARIQERRRWAEICQRIELDSFKPTTARGYISDDQMEGFWRLRTSIHPSVARVTYSISQYLFSRYSYLVGGGNLCDACYQGLAFIRYTCVTCMEEDLSNQVDMCAECIDSSTFEVSSKYMHHPSHTLIRFTRRFYDCTKATIIPQARTRSDRVKASFKTLEHNTTNARDQGKKAPRTFDADRIVRSKPKLTQLVCASCRQDLTLPCWACATCVKDTLICFDCESKNNPVPKPEGVAFAHTRHHPLLRISQSDEVKATEAKPIRLDKELASLEARLNDSLSELENKINTRQEKLEQNITAQKEGLSNLQERLEQLLETKVDDLRSMLQELLAAVQSPKIGNE